VVEVAPDGTQHTVGSGFSGPNSVAVDAAGNVYVSDHYSGTVVEVAPDGTQHTVGSGFYNPYGVAVDAAGDVYIADANQSSIIEVAPGGSQSTVGSGLFFPRGMAVDAAGDVYVADANNSRVEEVEFSPSASSSDPGSASVAWATPLSDGGSIVDRYTVTAVDTTNSAHGGQTCTTNSATATSCSVSGLTGGDTYTFSVTATNGSGTSASSNQSNMVTPFGKADQSPLAIKTTTGPWGTALPLSTTGGSDNGTVTFVLDTGGTASGCAVTSAGSLGATSAGTCKVTATMASNDSYNAVSSAVTPITFTPAPQTIHFIGTAPAPAYYGSTYTVGALASSGLPVTFSPSAYSACTISGSTVTFLTGVGTCTIVASQAGNTNYSAAPHVTLGITVAASPTTLAASPRGLLFTSVSATLKSITGTPISGAVITFTSAGGTIGSATTNASGVATYSITLGVALFASYTASFAGNADYLKNTGSAAL
jgi:hypothetical protein